LLDYEPAPATAAATTSACTSSTVTTGLGAPVDVGQSLNVKMVHMVRSLAQAMDATCIVATMERI
jgi:hypothetical protein